jgi:GntR family transcriptional regulator, carbon starvation induced regulator
MARQDPQAVRRVVPSENPKTLVESAYWRLRDDIVAGKRPPGSKLRVEHLKKEYDVSGGTLREALTLLVSDALVVSVGQRGFHVAPMSLSDFEDITRTRTLLETEALRLAIAHGDEEWEARVAAAFHLLSRAEAKLKEGGPGVAEEWEGRNRAFHEALSSACPSNWTRHFIAILYRQSERYRRLALFKSNTGRDVHAEHQALVDAALDRNAELACQVLSEHILMTLRVIKQIPQAALRRAALT